MSDVSVAAQGEAGAAGMRQAMADFVHAAHCAYLSQARLLPPAEQAALPLLAAGRLTVVAAAASNLHVLATTQALPPVTGREVELPGRIGAEPGDGTDQLGWTQLGWTLRFYDPVVLPGLGLVDERDGARPEEVRRLLGLGTVLYHLVVAPGSQLTQHHAAHLGAGLAGSHATVFRGLATLRDRLPRRQVLVDELAGAIRGSLPVAATLLAAALLPAEPRLAELAELAELAGLAKVAEPAEPAEQVDRVAELISVLLAATGRTA